MRRDRLPATGDVWLSRLDPTEEFEQAGTRPVLIVSGERYNNLQPRLRIILPMTTRDRGLPFQIRIDPPVGGVRSTSFVICEQPRTVSISRLLEYWGSVPVTVLNDARRWVDDFLHDEPGPSGHVSGIPRDRRSIMTWELDEHDEDQLVRLFDLAVTKGPQILRRDGEEIVIMSTDDYELLGGKRPGPMDDPNSIPMSENST